MLKDTLNPMKLLGYFKPLLGMRFAEGGGEGGGGEGGGEGGGGGGEDWRGDLPAEVKAHPILQKYNTKNDAVAALVSSQELIGADKIIMPSKDAKAEEWNERVFNRLGRPEKADAYVLPTDIEIPKELPMDENLMGSFKEVSHKVGLLPQQVHGIYRWYVENMISQFTGLNDARGTAMKDAETKLRTEWGASYTQNVALAQKVLGKFASPEATELLAQGLGNDPRIVKLFAEVGKVLSEDQLAGKPKSLTMTPDEANAEISKINNDRKHPYWIADHIEHKAAVEKMAALMAMAEA